ncbi:MAG: replication factor C large subunit [Candidatus Micrarchaeia archaeon]
MLLCEKYAPNTLNEIKGNRQSVDRLIKFAISAQSNIIEKPILIYGPPGTGKTAAAHALAYSNGFELLELNSSDYRSEEKLNKLLVPASMSQGIFKKKMLILLDEIDELSSKFDVGAEKAINELLQVSKHPIIFIANDYWDRKIAFLRGKVEPVAFKKLSADEVYDVLSQIVKKEKKSASETALRELALRSNGDIRGAINDLEFIIDGSEELIEDLGTRNRTLEVFGLLDRIFLSRNFDSARKALSESDTELGMLVNWVDENVITRYRSKRSIREAYKYIASASFFLEKAERTKYYGYLRYSDFFIAGVSLANDGNVSLIKNYMFPSLIKYMSSTKKARDVKSAIVSKLVYEVHAHKRDIISSYLPLLTVLINEGTKQYGEEKTANYFESLYGLSSDEIRELRSIS